jgi:hypothetical protein
MSAAQVTISLDELDELRGRLRKAHEDNAALSADMRAAEIASAGDRADGLLATIRQGLVVVRFAVANLDPETIRGWPWEALHGFAGSLSALPGATDLDRELAIELRAFSRACERREIERTGRPLAVSAPTV